MIYAVKGNKSYQVGDDLAQQNAFLARGYDLVDEHGKVMQYSPVKTVPYAQYAAVLKENTVLKEQLATVQKGKK